MIKIGQATLYHGDCMELMRNTPDNYYELAIVDPPYGIGDFSQSDAACLGKIKWNNEIPSKEYFDELRRVSKNQIIWGANYYNCFNGGSIVWDKLNLHPSMSRCEIASVSYGKRVAYVQILHHGGAAKMGGNFHPCGKPIKLYEWLLTNYAKTGDKILDTHGGSFSSAIACNNLGFDFTGIELDLDYYNSAVKRVSAANQQIRMFA